MYFVLLIYSVFFCCASHLNFVFVVFGLLFNELGGKGFGLVFCWLANQLCALQENVSFQKIQLD
jgi:hypothetical protein